MFWTYVLHVPSSKLEHEDESIFPKPSSVFHPKYVKIQVSNNHMALTYIRNQI